MCYRILHHVLCLTWRKGCREVIYLGNVFNSHRKSSLYWISKNNNHKLHKNQLQAKRTTTIYIQSYTSLSSYPILPWAHILSPSSTESGNTWIMHLGSNTAQIRLAGGVFFFYIFRSFRSFSQILLFLLYGILYIHFSLFL